MNSDKYLVLIVDDSTENLDILNGILQDYYHVRAARDGKTALSIAASDNQPDCILLDVMMPEMDGFEVCRHLKSNSRTEMIPVIFITASGEIANESTGFAVGGADYITKPVSPPLVLARVKSHIELYYRNRNLDELVHKRTGELSQANELLRNIMESSSSAIFQITLDGTLNYFNSQALKMTGYNLDDLKKITYDMLFDPDNQKDMIDCFTKVINRQTPIIKIEAFLSRKDDKITFTSNSLSPYIINDKIEGIVLITEDITEHRAMELQLIHTDKMSAIGEMATGIAHELNQPLNVIKMATQLIQQGIEDKSNTDEFIKERSDKILAQVDRAAKIINHLRTFGRKSDTALTEIDINTPIQDAFMMFEEQMKIHSIECRLDLAKNLPKINGDTHRLEQVFINLIANSRDALYNVRSNKIDKKILIQSFYNDYDNMVVVSFTDNGPGIPKKYINRIFEPFFTTKGIGSGTGLGLSITYGIIQSHKGTITVESNNNGTTFTMKFPAI